MGKGWDTHRTNEGDDVLVNKKTGKPEVFIDKKKGTAYPIKKVPPRKAK